VLLASSLAACNGAINQRQDAALDGDVDPSDDSSSEADDAGSERGDSGTPKPGDSFGSTSGVKTGLSPLPEMVNVKATVLDDSAEISFSPVDTARDYRVYVLPADADITTAGDGRVTVKNAVYRCAGDRQASATVVDKKDWVQGFNINTLVDGQDVEGYKRTLADSTLGYVYETPGDGRTPVYALGDSAADADVDCDFLGAYTRWQESRAAKYVSSEQERQMLLKQRWRDDGIVFYVPSDAGSSTRKVFVKGGGSSPRLYYAEGAEATTRGAADLAFNVLKEAEDGAVPLKRVFYKNFCGQPHDVLVAGNARFERARRQGDNQPVDHLHWAGLTEETTLVVEALADGCPYQGFLAPESAPARDGYARWLTLDELKAASPTGEIYINGQHEKAQAPRPIARSFLKVKPVAPPEMDWFLGFDSEESMGKLATMPCGVGNCFATSRVVSNVMDVSFMLVEDDRHALARHFGELWVSYADLGADVNGKFRITAASKATMSDKTFIHATMTVDAFTTGRRYPQIIISDQDAPVQLKMEFGHALVFQTFGGWPYTFEAQVCDHQFWDVNNQCPRFDSHHVVDANDPDKFVGLLPHPEPGEHSGMDRGTKFDVYASTKRAYWFLDGEPYACADLPAVTVGAGPATVTFGDVLYHSGVDMTFAYTGRALQVATRRHFDNLGFSSGVAAPAWDESRFPCAKTLRH
jgi:hypothetical protein